MLKNSSFGFIIIFLTIFIASTAIAGKTEISGYTSLIGTKTDAKDATYWNEYAADYADFTHQSLIGVQLNAEIVKNLEISLTILGEGKEKYKAEFSWFYATYTITDNSSFRFGRLKVPIYMVSNYIDIGHAYPWVTPPPEVYSTNVIESSDGLEYIYATDIFASTLQINTYVGTNQNDHHLAPSFINDGINSGGTYKTGDKVGFQAHDLLGIEVSLATDNVTFKFSHNQAIMSSTELSITKSRIQLGGFGIIIDAANFIIYSEYVHRYSDDSLQSVFPDQDSGYVTLGYRIAKFLPYITYATIDKGKTDTKYAVVQESNSVGLRYDVNTKMAIKFQATKTKPGSNSGDVGRYGLYDQEIIAGEEPSVYSMSVDILF